MTWKVSSFIRNESLGEYISERPEAVKTILSLSLEAKFILDRYNFFHLYLKRFGQQPLNS
jgi:hypothetical protein